MTVYTTGLIILVLSVLGGLILVRRNKALDQTLYKILMFGLYFWLLVFLQGIIASLIYQTFYN